MLKYFTQLRFLNLLQIYDKSIQVLIYEAKMMNEEIFSFSDGKGIVDAVLIAHYGKRHHSEVV